MSYETIEVRIEADKVGIVTLNRPKQLNALNDQLMDELGAALKAFDADEKIGCIIVTGSEKAFAAGADIGAMAKYSFADTYKGDYITRNWEAIRSIRKPVIAAVIIAGFSQVAVMAAKESVNRAFEGSLSDGVMFERRLFHALFSTQDQKEGMDAFMNKRTANFTHQ